jgi:UDP-glucuronate decarboxylase
LSLKHRARLLFTSTSEIYGDPLEHPQKESYWGHVNPMGERSCYDEGKRVAETLMFLAYKKSQLFNGCVVRIFNTYGPGMSPNDGRIISNFVTNALQGKSIEIYGGGSQTRSLCYVDDMMNGLVLMMNSKEKGPINLGNPVEFSVLTIANIIVKSINPESSIVFKPLPSDDPTQRRPDITQAKEKLGWQPTISFEEGLVKTVNYFKQLIDQKDNAGL